MSIYLRPTHLHYVLMTLYAWAMAFEIIQITTVMYYSENRLRDLKICLVFPLAPFYQLFLMMERIIANTRELFFRTSFKDNFVPIHVRNATWKW